MRLAQRWGGFDPDAELNRRKLDLVNKVADIAGGAGLPVSHLATAWSIVHPDVTSTIIGPRTMEQLQDSLLAADVVLTDDVLDALDDLLPPGTDVNTHDPSSAPRELEAWYRRSRRGGHSR